MLSFLTYLMLFCAIYCAVVSVIFSPWFIFGRNKEVVIATSFKEPFQMLIDLGGSNTRGDLTIILLISRFCQLLETNSSKKLEQELSLRIGNYMLNNKLMNFVLLFKESKDTSFKGKIMNSFYIRFLNYRLIKAYKQLGEIFDAHIRELNERILEEIKDCQTLLDVFEKIDKLEKLKG